MPKPEHYVQNRQVVHQEIDDETIVLNPETGKFFCLNGIASCLWPLLEAPQSRESLVTVLVEILDAPPERCGEDVDAFLSQLVALGLIDSAPEPAP